MTKTAKLKQQPLSTNERNLVEIIEAYEQSKMNGLTIEEFVYNYADMFATEGEIQ